MGATGTSTATATAVPIAPGLPAGSIPGYFTAKDTYPTSIDTAGLPTSDWSTALWAEALINTINQKLPKGTAPVLNNITNVNNILSWMHAEGADTQSGGFLRDNNPLNLNTFPGSSSSLANGKIVNEFGTQVQTFNSVQDGIDATANAIINPSSGKTTALLNALQIGAPSGNFGTALATSDWAGTGYDNAKTFASEPATIVYGSGDTITQNNASATGGANPGEAFPGQDQLNSLANATGITYFVDLLKSIAGDGKNIAIFAGGFVLAGVGLVLFISTTKEGKSAEKIGATAAVA